MAGIGRHDADVRGHDVRLERHGQIEDALRFFDQIGIQLGIAKSVAQIAAQRGDNQAVILDHLEKFLLRGGRGNALALQRLGGRVNLQSLRAQRLRDVHRLGGGLVEGLQHNANRELAHRHKPP